MDSLTDVLHIPSLYVRPTQINNLHVAAVSQKWLSDLTKNLKVPDIFLQHDIYSPDEIQAFLWDSETILGPGWTFVNIQIVPKPSGHVLMPSLHSDARLDSKDLSYSQFLHYVSQTNYKNLWKESQKKFPEAYRSISPSKSRNQRKTEAVSLVRALLSRIFNNQICDVENGTIYPQCSLPPQDHIIKTYAILEFSSSFLIFLEHIPTSIHQCLSLSPGLLNQNSPMKLFLTYQLLEAVREIQDRSLFVEGVQWHHIFITETLSLKTLPAIIPSLIPLAGNESPAQKAECSLEQLTKAWVRGCISNYDYLMTLNDLAGRQMDNPFHHPVLPWISDLNSPFGNWRDMTKSKFRLNKGDRQLDLTFDPTTFETPEGKEVGPGIPGPHQVPHHVTDVLSEITVYVYKARRTPRSVLCRYVRPNWNPLEYPSSIERMQQWTPDECIPQFFSDPSIFKSIHDDLPDLGHPSWATSPEDFVTKHRNALESPYVSERLHHWIDLTFGFRLSGTAAVKSKNVHLSLVDQHTHLSRRGVVQLFTQPHPRRLLPSPYVGRSPPRLPPVGRCPAEDNLSLPLDYNPVSLLQQLETVNQFCERSSKNQSPASQTKCSHQVAVRRQRDLQWMASLALELFLPLKFRLLSANATLEDRMQICRRVYTTEKSDVPRCLRSFLKAVFDNEIITEHGLPPPSAHQLLQPMVSLIPFPAEFPALEAAVRHLNQLLDQTHSDFAGAGRMISSLSGCSSIYLLVPLVKSLFQKAATSFHTALHLFEPMAAALGPQEASKEFLSLLLKLMSPEEPPPFLILLYHRRFLLMLQIRLGLRCFLNNFTLLLVEAVGGCYDTSPACVLDLVDPKNESMEAHRTKGLSASVDAETEGASEAGAEGGVFSFETGEEVGLDSSIVSEEIGQIPGTPSRNSSKFSVAAVMYPVRDIHQLNECTVSQISADSLLWLSTERLGPVLTARYLTRNLLRMLALCYVDETSLTRLEIDQINKEINPLFHMTGSLIQGDLNAGRILTCLSSVAGLYGEQFVLLQYLPHAVEVASRCVSSGNVSLLLEGGLMGCCSLILETIPCLQDSSFMSCLRETVIRQVLQPVTDTVISSKQLFSRGGLARSALATKVVDCICAVAIRLGADAAAPFISELVIKLLKSFELVAQVDPSEHQQPSATARSQSEISRPEWMTHQRRLSSTLRQAINASDQNTMPSSGPPASEAQSRVELSQTFTDQFAFHILSTLNMVLGVFTVQQLVEQSGKAVQRSAARWASKNDEVGSQPNQKDERRSSVFSGMRVSRSFSDTADGVSGSYGSRVSVIGNRIQLFEEEDEASTDTTDTRPTVEEAQNLLCYRKTESSRHLRGNWLAFWEHESGRHDRDTRFNFKQIRLMQMSGHTAGIRTIHVMDNEFGVITAGRDKTARVWSLHSQGDGGSTLPARFVYTHHRKPLLGVGFIEASRLAASCDGAVHLWDPFVGTSVRQMDATSSNRFPTVTAMKALPSPSASLIVATAEGTLRLLDTRSPLTYQQELKISPISAGLVRCLSAGPNGQWVAAGHSSGILSLVDLRTGMLMSSWKGHEGEVLQVNSWASPSGSQYLISSSLDQSISVWSADDGKFKFNFRGSAEPVHCLSIGGGELITATTANRIGVYTSLTPNASFSSTKLRSDTFKGVLTSLAIAPLNRILLLGSDSGMVSVFC